ncbi:hypothetical protein ONZ45_g2574 [Pleurotus djamor]|nr:hypothetical protein ONZ45_g18728 [Pleurotus djamor]KAJ8520650.1 hypothetical protein ONZ45_g2574 [Pleurotus djamor]
MFSSFSKLIVFTTSALAIMAGANPVVNIEPDAVNVESPNASPLVNLMTLEEMKNWIRTSQAQGGEFKFIGEKLDLRDNPLASRDAQLTTVTFCSNRNGNNCNPPCTTFTGSNACLSAPNTNCLSATTQVTFCDRSGCSGSCNTFNQCGTRLNNNFCFTPGTASIRVP